MGQRRRVLIIDNYADVVESLHGLLESWGYEVENAANGREGLAAFVARKHDVVIVDLSLPDIDGNPRATPRLLLGEYRPRGQIAPSTQTRPQPDRDNPRRPFRGALCLKCAYQPDAREPS